MPAVDFFEERSGTTNLRKASLQR